MARPQRMGALPSPFVGLALAHDGRQGGRRCVQVSNALEGDADAKAQLKRVFERWAELNELLVGSQKEAMAATGALTWMAGLGGEALVRPAPPPALPALHLAQNS